MLIALRRGLGLLGPLDLEDGDARLPWGAILRRAVALPEV
jgi:hypothetical protein